jgi:hypothetical protein
MRDEPVCCVAPLSGDILALAVARVLAARERMSEIRMHPNEYADLLLLGVGTLAGSLCQELQCELTRTGVWPTTLYGASVVCDADLDAGTVVVRGHAGATVYVEVLR